jgi:CCR4-NOT transcription complex subunit 6
MLDDVSAADAASNNIAWTKICSEKTYIPMSSEVGCRFKVEVCALSIADNAVLAGPIVVCTEAVLSLPSAPPKRRLIGIPGAIAGMSGAVRFRVISYNILADLYATKQAYPYCDTWSLVWPYRRKLIQAELEELQGDIVCLQEVQQDHYNQDINPFMTQLGYDGVYRAKSRDYGCGFGKVDGCATFWKRNKFIMTENYTIEFNEIARGEAINLGLEEQEARKFMNR